MKTQYTTTLTINNINYSVSVIRKQSIVNIIKESFIKMNTYLFNI